MRLSNFIYKNDSLSIKIRTQNSLAHYVINTITAFIMSLLLRRFSVIYRLTSEFGIFYREIKSASVTKTEN